LAEIVWTRAADADLETIADYIALEAPAAAAALVARVHAHVDQLERFPRSGSVPPELPGRRYRQIVEPPCRVFYRVEGARVVVLHVMRSEQRLRPTRLRLR
jgi:plasmid stabilization system protein ParE